MMTTSFRVLRIMLSAGILILCAVQCMAWTETYEGVKEGPVTTDQLKYIASIVCRSLFPLQYKNLTTCENNFINSSQDILRGGSELQYLCRTKNNATFSIAPAEGNQLVLLLPDSDIGNIGYKIMQSSEKIGTIKYISESYNYMFWTTSLHKDGSHSHWRQGPMLPPSNANATNVTIKETKFDFNYENKKYIATFLVDVSGELNMCTTFEVVNICNKGQLFATTYKLNTTTTRNESKLKVIINDLHINDRCILKLLVSGNLVRKERFRTPIPKNTLLPENAVNVDLKAIATIFGWNIIVSWDQPKKWPHTYNLTLETAGGMKYMVLPGGATNCTFEDVVDEEGSSYNVSIYSYFQNGTAFTFRQGRFPPRPSYQAVIITGSSSLILLLVAATLSFCLWWWRRKKSRKMLRYFVPLELKLVKEGIKEPCEEPRIDDRWELRSDRLLMHEVIGEGAFGVVRRGTLAPGAKEVAVKMLKEFPTLEEYRSFRAEMELMKSVGAHPHIVSLVGCCSGRQPLIVAEYCSRGDLLSFLRCSWDVIVSKRNAKYHNNNIESFDRRNSLFKKQKDPFPSFVVNKLYDLQGVCDTELTPLELLSFCRQIALGMEFLESNKVVHRDLAARNILVTRDRTLKIADFGLSRDVYQENQYKQKGNGKMPVKWMALESLKRQIYTTQSDVWSFGVVVWEVVTFGETPYPEVPAAKLRRWLEDGNRLPRPNNCSVQLYELMSSCWQERPRDRPKFAELHQRLDQLLNSACADQYLSLELDYEPPPRRKPRIYEHITMLLRGNLPRARGESYERPLTGPHSNHYTTTPHSTNA